MTQMNWPKIRLERICRDHGTESITENSTLPMREGPYSLASTPASTVNIRKGLVASRTITPATRAQSSIAKPPLNPVLLARRLESWSRQDRSLTACTTPEICELREVSRSLASRLNRELQRRAGKK
jgi:hypothetical protein